MVCATAGKLHHFSGRAHQEVYTSPVEGSPEWSVPWEETKSSQWKCGHLYAQDLRRLFYLAYPQAQQGTQDAEDMGPSVLCYQFVTGLLQEIKLKLAVVEGLLARAIARLQRSKAERPGWPHAKGFSKETLFLPKRCRSWRSSTSSAGEQPHIKQDWDVSTLMAWDILPKVAHCMDKLPQKSLVVDQLWEIHSRNPQQWKTLW